MRKIVLVLFILLLPVSALAEPAIQNIPPSPGTIEDPSAPIKLQADGPPRPLIKLNGPAKPIQIASQSGVR